MIFLNKIVLFLIKLYKLFLSPFWGQTCRFYPTCSSYAEEAYKTYGFFKATALVCKRLYRCRPGGGHGIDFLPKENESKESDKDATS